MDSIIASLAGRRRVAFVEERSALPAANAYGGSIASRRGGRTAASVGLEASRCVDSAAPERFTEPEKNLSDDRGAACLSAKRLLRCQCLCCLGGPAGVDLLAARRRAVSERLLSQRCACSWGAWRTLRAFLARRALVKLGVPFYHHL